MYPVSANFHTLAIADSPKTRCRIYFISDAVNCWDDNDVQTNGTLLVGAAGDTDSNGRIGQGGVTVTEIFNKDKNLTIGGTVSYQVGMTLVNADGALNNFAFGRCKVYLDVYDDANSVWLPCPLGVFRIELPVKRKVQLITATGYDQMQSLNAIADTWWNGLNFTGGLTIANILNSMVAQLGLHLSATSSTNMVNTTLSFTTQPIDSVERTYRDILGWIAEATGTVAHFNRDGELDMRPYLTPQIGGNNIVIDTDTTGNQCLSIDVAEYSVSRIDALTIKLTTSDQGVTVGSGTNVYTIMDNPFLYGPDVATIQNKLTPIYNRLRTYVAFAPISTRLIYDWSIEAGDYIRVLNDSVTYLLPIFQQKLVWRGGYVTAELLSSGDPVRPQVSSSERQTYRYNVEMATKVGDNEIISKINQTAEQIQIQASKVNLTGYITATNLATAGQTVINGGNITTGELSADRISGGTLTVGGVNDQNGQITILNNSGDKIGSINNAGYFLYNPGTNATAVQIGRYGNGGSYINVFDDVRLGGVFLDATNTGGGDIWVAGTNGAVIFSVNGNTGITTANNTTINGVLDVTQRRCYASLSRAGWYRVLKAVGGAGGWSFSIDFDITRSYVNTNNEVHSVKMLKTYNVAPSFVNEASKTNALNVGAIRYTIDSDGVGYVDIRYDANSANTVAVDFTVHTNPDQQPYFTAESLQWVAPSPSGETVMAEYTFAANTITDISSSFALNTSGISGLTGKIHAIYDASAGLVHLNFSAYTAGATFGTSTPIFTCSNSKYLPKTTTNGNGMIKMNSSEWYPYEVGIGSNGTIFQFLTGTATRVYGQITYQV